MRRGFLAAVVSVTILAGCTSAGDAGGVPFTGESHADTTLKRDTLKIIRTLVKARGCESIDHVDTKVLFYEPTTQTAGHLWAREGWMVTGCASPFPFYVSFTEDGGGGSYFAVTPK